jgi:hypothetical protein
VIQFVEPATADAAAIAATQNSALPPQLLQSASARPAGSFVVGLLAALAVVRQRARGGLPSDHCEAELAKLLLAVDLPAIPAWAPAVSAWAAATLPDADVTVDPEHPTDPEDVALALEICGGHIPSACVGALARLPEHDGAGPAGRIVAAKGGQIWVLGAGGSTTVSKVAATAVELVPWPSTGNALLNPAQIVGAVQVHQVALHGADGGWHGAWLALLALRGCKAALDGAADPGAAAAIATGLVKGGLLPRLMAAAASAGVSGPMAEAVTTLEGKALELLGKVWELPREERLTTSSGGASLGSEPATTGQVEDMGYLDAIALDAVWDVRQRPTTRELQVLNRPEAAAQLAAVHAVFAACDVDTDGRIELIEMAAKFPKQVSFRSRLCAG